MPSEDKDHLHAFYFKNETKPKSLSNSVKYICEIFLALCPGGGSFDSLFCLGGRVSYTVIVLGGLPPLSRVSGVCREGGMVEDEIGSRIRPGIWHGDP